MSAGTRGELESPITEGMRRPSPITPHRKWEWRLWHGDCRLSLEHWLLGCSGGCPRPACCLAAMPHTSCPLSSRAYGGGFCEYPDRIMDQQVGRGIRRTGKGTQEAPAASRRGPELPAQGQRGVGPSGAEGWPLVPEVTAGANAGVSTFSEILDESASPVTEWLLNFGYWLRTGGVRMVF